MHPIHVLLAGQAGSEAVQKAAEQVRARAEEWGLTAEMPRASGPAGDRVMALSPCRGELADRVAQALLELPAVLGVTHGPEPIFHVLDRARTAASLPWEDGQIGEGYTALFAGPCSAELDEGLIAFAHSLREAGASAFRAGAYKPRTSPYHFAGMGPAGLEVLAAIRREVGLPIVTELLDPRDADAVAAVADLVQIGSRNMTNAPLLREAAQTGRPVLLKRGMAATLSEFLQAAETLADAGADRILLCERGLRHFDRESRNLLDLSAVSLLKTRTHLPVLVDPSHGVGRADLVPSLCAAAAAVGADGLLLEVHPDPARSVSDAAQALSLPTFRQTAATVERVLTAVGRQLVRPRSSFSAQSHSSDDAPTAPRR